MRLLHWVVICDNQKYINMDLSKVCGIYKLRPGSLFTKFLLTEINRKFH